MIALRPSRPGRSVWASCSSIISSSTCLARASQGALGHAPSLLSDVRNDAEVPRRSRTAEFFRDYLMQVMRRARGPSAHVHARARPPRAPRFTDSYSCLEETSEERRGGEEG